MPAPRLAKFSPTEILWSNGEKFSGFILTGIVPPTYSGTPTIAVLYGESYPSVNLPPFSVAPVSEGKISSACGLFYNEDLSPPNSQYVYWFYDGNGRQVAGPSALFTVASGEITLPALTLTAPAPGSVIPTPV